VAPEIASVAPCRLVVVDNASGDGSADKIRSAIAARGWGGFTTFVASEHNGGFSYGNNLGLRALGLLAPPARGSAPPADYVLYLNPDTELPPGAVEALVRLMEARPEIGALSPRLVRADGSLDMACRRALPTPWNTFCHVVGLDRLWPRSPRFAEYNLTYLPEDRPTAVGCVAAAFMLVRAAAVARVGPWDETFFAYGEDIDYCLRVRRAGWLIWYEPSVRVLHLKGAASQQRSLPMLREFYRAMDVYYRKHFAARHPLPLRLAITAAVRALYTAALLRQLARPAGKRWVGAARPTKL